MPAKNRGRKKNNTREPDTSPAKDDVAGNELTAWHGLLAVHGRLAGQLDADLNAAHGLPLVEFQVLARLVEADTPMPMSELATAASLSRSGLTRVVDVLEKQRLLTRAPDGTDGRVVRAGISAAGRSRLALAVATRTATLERFFAPLSPKQTRSLGKTWATLLSDRPG